MAIANMLGPNAGVSFNRPSVLQREANDNVVRTSSDLMKTGMNDLVSILSKMSDSLKDVNNLSRQVLDGFKKAILSIVNVEKSIRSRFTYLQKDITASNKNLLAAINSMSFAAAMGYGSDDSAVEMKNAEGKVTPFAGGGGGGGPNIPPVIPPGGGGGKPSSGGGPVNTRPGKAPPETRPATARPGTPRPGAGSPDGPNRTGTPTRARPSTPALDIKVPGASVSMEFTPRAGAGVSGANVPGMSTQGTAKFGVQGPYTASLPSTPGGQPAKAPAPAAAAAAETPGAPARATPNAPKVKPSVALRAAGPAMLALGPIVAAIEAKAEMQEYGATGNKENLKNVYGIIGRESGALAGGLGAGFAAAAAGGPAAPLTGILGGIIGAMEGGELGEITGRAYYNVAQENMKWGDAWKLEALRYAANKQRSQLDAQIAIQTNRLKGMGVEGGIRGDNYSLMQDKINSLTKGTAAANQALMEFEKQLEEAKKTSESSNGTDPLNPTTAKHWMLNHPDIAAAYASLSAEDKKKAAEMAGSGQDVEARDFVHRRGVIPKTLPAQMLTGGQGGQPLGRGGPDLEALSRETQQQGMGTFTLPAIETEPQTNMIGGGGTEGIAGYPNFVLDASNAFVMDYQKQLFNYMGNVPTRAG